MFLLKKSCLVLLLRENAIIDLKLCDSIFFMTKNYQLIFVIGFLSLAQTLFGQDSYASLEKNFNTYAKELSHELNNTKDTLYLKSPNLITYVYSINEDYKREIDTYAGKEEFKVALAPLTKGKHVFVVTEGKKRIIFVIRKHADTPAEIKKVNEIELALAKSKSNQG